MTLSWLINPFSVDHFLGTFWEKKPIHIVRDDPAYFGSLFSLADLDELLGFSTTNTNVRTAWQGHQNSHVIRDGAHKTSICQFYEYYAQGQTVVIRNIHQRWPKIGEICNALSRQLGCRVGTHLYATPEGSQGFGIHWDDHDIFALQIDGEKSWCLYDSGPHLPRKSRSDLEYLNQVIENPGEPIQEIVLRAGDLLYFPRGVIHRALAQQKASLHLTFGIYAITWEDALLSACDQVDGSLLDRSLPPGSLLKYAPGGVMDKTFEPLFKNLLNGIDDRKVSAALAAKTLDTMQVLTDGHFEQIDDLMKLNRETILEKRPGMLATLLDKEESVTLVFPGNCHHEPFSHREALAFITQEHQFRAGDLPLPLSEGLLLLRTLISKGFLRMASH